MKLSKTYIANVDKYINSRFNGGLLEYDGIAIANNSASLILFTPILNDDGSGISPVDFTGINVKEYPNFKDGIWKYVIEPYWDDRTRAYKPLPTTLFLDDIKKDVVELHNELEIPIRTKLYDESITQGRFKTDVALMYGGDDGIWLNPELLYDVAKLITSKSKPVDIWIPFNRKLPAGVVGENKYGKHLGFVLGTVKNYKEN